MNNEALNNIRSSRYSWLSEQKLDPSASRACKFSHRQCVSGQPHASGHTAALAFLKSLADRADPRLVSQQKAAHLLRPTTEISHKRVHAIWIQTDAQAVVFRFQPSCACPEQLLAAYGRGFSPGLLLNFTCHSKWRN